MTKRHPQIDNHFSPSAQPEGSLFTVIFGAVALAFGAGLMALAHASGVL